MARTPGRRQPLVGLCCALLVACGTSSTSTASTPTPSPSSSTNPGQSTVDPKALPLGDGHVSSSAKAGYVWSCQTQFGGGGAAKAGPWIQGSAWDSTTKIAVKGTVKWSQAAYTATISGANRVLTTKDVPVNQTTGTFPVAASDPAAAYDRNPNRINSTSSTLTIPANPAAAVQPTCLPGGPIGMLIDGVYLFNALDGQGRDAVAHELLDTCGGHPEMTGQYHHHDVPACLQALANGSSNLVGYAKDGFGIFVDRSSSGGLLTNADLDACHGRTSQISWDSQQVSMYHYVATLEYPYTVGCYMGAAVR
ncbi:MAG TPA: YHYH protein [Candidatus Dormibacteraeota bacterium]|nr:YHYH protein [Candidatus Dormibacteraeota bacterium]